MTFLALLLLYGIIGALAGLLGGALGIGGGLVVVPCLLLIFQFLGFPSHELMHFAIGTSLGAMVFTTASAAFAHHLKKGIDWHLFKQYIPSTILGAVAGVLIAKVLSSNILELVFGFFEALVGLYFLFFTKASKSVKKRFSLSYFLAHLSGLLIGSISSLMGIGGGIITVPFFLALGTPMKNAVATSALISFFIALIGALSFLILGLGEKMVSSAIGYFYLPALVGVGLISTLLAPYGAKMAYTLPITTLKRVFGGVLILAGLSMLSESLSHL